jgi:hypothetical protein
MHTGLPADRRSHVLPQERLRETPTDLHLPLTFLHASRSGLRLVHRGVRYARPEGGEGAPGRAGGLRLFGSQGILA